MRILLPQLLAIALFTMGPGMLYPQQIPLQGQISIHNSKSQSGRIKYVKDAEISAPFTTPVSSDEQGQFRLLFAGLESGITIDVSVAKPELEVVNKRHLQNVVLGRKSTLKVFLAPIGEIAKARTELYDISLRALTARHEQLIRQLHGAGDESEALLLELERKLNRTIKDRFAAERILNYHLDELKAQLPETVKRLASVNLDFASESYREAVALYNKGEIEAAIAKLDSIELKNVTQQTLVNIQNIKSDQEKYMMAIEEEEQRIDQIENSYRLKAESYNLLFDYRAAARVFQKLVQLLEKTKGSEDLALADAYDDLGRTYRNLGEYTKALLYRQKNVAIKEKVLEPDAIELASSLNNLALIYKDTGNFKAALEIQNRAIATVEKNPGIDPLHIAESYNNLALINHGFGKYKESLSALQIAHSIREQKLDPYHPDLAQSYSNLAHVHKALGEYDKALEMQLKDISIKERVLEPNHPSIAISYNNLSLIYRSLGQNEEGLKAQKKSLAIRKKILVPNHPKIGTSYNNLAVIYQNLKRYEEALEAIQLSIKMQEKVLNPEHPNIAASYNNLSLIYLDLNEPEKALPHQLKAMTIRKKTLDINHPVLAISYNNLALVYRELGKYEEALEVQQNALSIMKEALDPNHPNIAMANFNLGIIYHKLKDLNTAIKYCEKAHAIGEIKLASDHPYLKQITMEIANYYLERGQLAQENKEFTKAIQDFQRALEFQPENQQTIKLLASLNTTGPHAGLPSHEASTNFSSASSPRSSNDYFFQETNLDETQLKALLVESKFSTVEQKAMEALGNDPNNNSLRIIIALAWLYQGNYQKAKDIWFIFKNQTLQNGEKFSVRLGQELDFLVENGMTGPQVARYQKLIKSP